MADPYEPDRPVICPYDSSHSIAQSRIQKHLVKCAKNFPPNYKISCPFNATHRLSEMDLTDHVLRCPDNQYVDRSVWDDHTKYHNHGSITSCHEMEDRSVIVCDESWDDEESLGMDAASASVYRYDSSELPKIQQAPSFTVTGGPINPNTIRPPKGRPEALMMEESGDSTLEDIESVVSFAGIGRGKPWIERNTKLLEQLGRGRGSRQPQNLI